MKTLYFVRHGLSEMNVQGLIASITETPLTAEGRRQAKLAGKLAKEYRIDCIASSPRSRALETAQIIAKGIGYPTKQIHVNNLLRERHYGSLEGQPWSPDLDVDGFSDVETADTILERAHLALKWLETLECDNLLVVSHGGFGRALRAAIRKEKVLDYTKKLQNAEIQKWL